MSFDDLFANPNGRAGRAAFIPALITLLAVAVFYYVLVKSRTGVWCQAMLIFPFLMLHARRLHDMGQTAWLLAAPGALMVAATWLQLYGADSALTTPVTMAALVVSAGFALWGLAVKGQAEANRFGEPAAA